MRLTSIRIEQFRQFRQPLRIDGLESGLNLFAGPNETGKSTVVTAIRAAFFERHRSSSVDDLRPWDDGSASPTVELEFVLNDQPCRLMKSFLGKKRCELQIGTQRFEGTDAEDRLAALLGFQYAGRGASGAEHWGIPGLLWIQQGAAQDIGDPVRHATDHLRTALNESLGEVASSGGDDVLAAVEAQRNELLTPAAGAPRGPYLEARNQVARLAGSLEELDATIEAYRQKVDALAELRREQARDEVDQPWLVFRKQEQASAQHLETVQRVERDLQTDRSRLSELERQLAQWRERLDGFDAQERDLNQRTVDREAARQAAQSADVTVQQWKTQCAAATGRHDAARATARVARLEAGRSGLAQQLEILRQKADAIRAKQTQVEAERLRLLDLETQAAASEIAADDLDALRTQHRLLHDAGIRLDGAATRLRFTLDPGCSALLGEDMVSGSGERQLTVPTTIAVPGFGWFEIMPGGTDLADLARDAATLRDTHFALLQRLGLPTFEAAEARHRNHDRLMRDIKASTAMLQALAPEGLDSLRSERHVTDAKIHELEQTLAQLPAPADGVPHPAAVSEAEAAEEEARRSLDRLTAELNRAQLTAADARSAEAAALREWAAARATIDAPERAGQRARIQQALIDARADQAALTVMIENRERQVTEARPDILRQDVERFRRSAEQHEARFGARRDQLLRLEVELQTIGAQGLDERRADMARELEQLRRRCDELGRRARALDHLLRLLRERRGALTRRLQAPLQKHLDHYLQVLFPHARLELDAMLTPGPLTRIRNRGPEIAAFEALSFGAREQLGVISRLAYADLLREARRPTLVILDDALVHADDERLAQMKRVLFDASTRHQLLIFTCHPGRWRDLGVAPRAIGDTAAS